MVWTPKIGDGAVSAIMSKSEHRWVWLWALSIVGLTCLPYLLAWRLAPSGTQYTGLLINHFDGESYYAKMQQGARGDWLFHLAFTPEPHDGAFVFTFYLALGHLSAAVGLPLPLVYHLARAAAGMFLLLIAYRFIAHFFDRIPTRQTAFLLLSLSAGFGWLMAPLGFPIADLWVAEGFTFLSILANPHFPLAIGLMLLISLSVLDLAGKPLHPTRLAGAAGLGLLLAIVQPFAVPVILTVLAVYLGLVTWQRRAPPKPAILVTGAAAIGSAPIMLYDLYVYRTNPALAAWSAQNLTPSLPPWDYALGYGLVLLLALGGIVVTARRRKRTDIFLLAWVGSALVLLYVPFALQRRFIIGLHVPLTILATLGLEQIIWPKLQVQRRGLFTDLLVGFTALTNVFVPLVSVVGVAQGRPPLAMTADEAAACAWLRNHTAWTDTVLAPPDAGLFIPAWAGNRVVYGHPFETIDTETKLAEVTDFFSAATPSAERRALLERYEVRYVLSFTPESGSLLEALGLTVTWQQGNAALYRVEAGL
jgi:hypothetical protein